jgi:hypothetical protein
MPPGISGATVQHGAISNELAAIKQFQVFHFVLILRDLWYSHQHLPDDVTYFYLLEK